jgi:hypothetical protein
MSVLMRVIEKKIAYEKHCVELTLLDTRQQISKYTRSHVGMQDSDIKQIGNIGTGNYITDYFLFTIAYKQKRNNNWLTDLELRVHNRCITVYNGEPYKVIAPEITGSFKEWCTVGDAPYAGKQEYELPAYNGSTPYDKIAAPLLPITANLLHTILANEKVFKARLERVRKAIWWNKMWSRAKVAEVTATSGNVNTVVTNAYTWNKYNVSHSDSTGSTKVKVHEFEWMSQANVGKMALTYTIELYGAAGSWVEYFFIPIATNPTAQQKQQVVNCHDVSKSGNYIIMLGQYAGWETGLMIITPSVNFDYHWLCYSDTGKSIIFNDPWNVKAIGINDNGQIFIVEGNTVNFYTIGEYVGNYLNIVFVKSITLPYNICTARWKQRVGTYCLVFTTTDGKFGVIDINDDYRISYCVTANFADGNNGLPINVIGQTANTYSTVGLMRNAGETTYTDRLGNWIEVSTLQTPDLVNCKCSDIGA